MSILWKHKFNWQYAIGEILLIFIGITLAIAFQNWNESRNNDLLKSDYQRKLRVNLEHDIENYQYWLDITTMYEEESFYLLEFLEDRNVDVDTARLKRTLLISQMGTPFPINSSVYNELVSTGNLRLFQNLEFKNLIESYYQMPAGRLPIREADRKALWFDFADRKNKYLDPLLLREMHKESGAWKFEKPVDLSSYKVNWTAMKKDKEVARLLKLALVHREFMRDSYAGDLKVAKEIIGLMDGNDPL